MLRNLGTFGLDIEADVSILVDYLRTGEIDFAAEAQAAIGGTSTEIMEMIGSLTLLLIECEWQVEKSKRELQ